MKNELTELIRLCADNLLCETHPLVCAMRDADYPALEAKIIQILNASADPMSVQTALAQLEDELS